jgi:hypothetical protein
MNEEKGACLWIIEENWKIIKNEREQKKVFPSTFLRSA